MRVIMATASSDMLDVVAVVVEEGEMGALCGCAEEEVEAAREEVEDSMFRDPCLAIYFIMAGHGCLVIESQDVALYCIFRS